MTKGRDRGVDHRPVTRVRTDGGEGAPEHGQDRDAIVVEEPLEIRVAGDPLAITMRTPGEDARLAVGFLFAEGVIASIDDVGRVAHCGRPGEEGYGNAIDVEPGPGVALDPERVGASRRGTLTTAACGVCGRRSIDDLLERCEPIAPSDLVVERGAIARAAARLRDAQENFRRTGAIHAAAAFDDRADIAAVHEDVGRHNAVDKVVGQLLYERAIGRPALLFVSGRVGFEIVQKAVAARIPIVAGIGGPSSLAIDLAAASGVTLVAFARPGGFNLYTHSARVR